MPLEFEPDQGQGQQVQPDGQMETPPEPQGAGEPDFLEIKHRDQAYRVPKDLAQQMADAIGWDVNRLKDSLEIGADGSQIYARTNREREELDTYRQNLYAYAQSLAQQQAALASRPPAAEQAIAPAARPPADDVTGTVKWLADSMERLMPIMGRVPTIEETLVRTSMSFQEMQEAREHAEEKVIATNAYQDVASQWKKEGWGDLPPQQEMEQFLRRLPISDDIDMTWHDIWNSVGWMLGGAAVARRQKRQAVLDTSRPNARIAVPSGSAPIGGGQSGGMGVPAKLNGNESDEDIEANIKRLERTLQGVTLGQVRGN